MWHMMCRLWTAAPDASLPEEDGVGNPPSAAAVRVPRPVPRAAGGCVTEDGCCHIPHASWVQKSVHHLCWLTGPEL